MKLDYAFFASGADASRDGRLHVFDGEIGGMAFPAFPSMPVRLFLVIKLFDPPDEAGSRHRLVLTCNRRGDSEPIGQRQEFPVETKINAHDPQANSGAIVIAQLFVQFPKDGTYDFDIEVDGESLRVVPFYISTASVDASRVQTRSSPTATG